MALSLCLLLVVMMVGCGVADHPNSEKIEPDSILESTDCTAKIKFSDKSIEYLDLTPLKGQRLTVNGSDPKLKETYTWSVCQQANFSSEADGCLNQLFVYDRGGEYPECRGLGDTAEFYLPDHVLTLRLRDVGDIHHSASIRLACGPTEGELLCDSPEPLGCTLGTDNQFLLKSKYACLHIEAHEAATPVTPRERDWLKLSPGSIILIAAGSVFVTYLIIGLAHGTGKGEKGLNRLPNSDFWLELPLLVRDGVKYSFGCKSRYVPLPTMAKEDKNVPVVDV